MTAPSALYRFFDSGGDLLYIGITANIGNRWKSHAKTKPWWCEVANCTVEHFTCREDALRAEKNAIQKQRPKYNVVYNNQKISSPTKYSHTEENWVYHSLRSGYEKSEPLWLYWEVSGDPISDNYWVDEISAEDLWIEWIEQHGDDDLASEVFGIGAVGINWFIEGHSTIEGAPFRDDSIYQAYCEENDITYDLWKNNSFLAHYSYPRSSITREPVQWSRLPVIDKIWREDNLPKICASKGGFIQEATGWKPSPLQPFVNIIQLANMANLWLPTSLRCLDINDNVHTMVTKEPRLVEAMSLLKNT